MGPGTWPSLRELRCIRVGVHVAAVRVIVGHILQLRAAVASTECRGVGLQVRERAQGEKGKESTESLRDIVAAAQQKICELQGICYHGMLWGMPDPWGCRYSSHCTEQTP